MLDFDTMLMHVGEFGLYQKILFIFQAPFCIFVTFVSFGQLFMLLYPRAYWCQHHFACLNVNDSIPGPTRMNISFRWSFGGIFLSDRCEVNTGEKLNDDFLQWLSDYDARECSRNRSALCRVNFNDSGGKYGSGAAGNPQITTLRPNQWNSKPWTTRSPNYGQGGSGGYRNSRQSDGWGDGNGRGWHGAESSASSGYNPQPQPAPEYGGSSGQGGGGNGYGGSSGRFDNPRNPGPSGGGFGSQPYGEKFGQGGTGYGQGGQYGGSGGSSGGQGGFPNGGFYGGGNTQRPSSTTTFRTTTFKSITRKPESKGHHGSSPSQEKAQPNVANAWAGWPEPDCPKGRKKSSERIFIGNNTIIEAAEMHGFFQKRNHIKEVVYGNISADCNVTWNRSELPYETIVTEGEWWCWAEAYSTFAQALFFVGAIVGGFLIGWVADTYGRVPALVLANILGAIGGALSAVSTNVWLFSAFRFIAGMAFDNCFTMMYILVLEFCGPTYRTLVANLSIAIFYTIGTILLPVFARLINNWRIFALVISLPMLLGILALFFVPESARWLLSKGRTAQATKILRNFAKVNGRKVDEQIFLTFEEEATRLAKEWEDVEEPGLGAAFKTPRLRMTFVFLIIFWSMIALVYDGHNRNIMNLANEDLDVFWLFAIASSTEFPADMLLIFTLDTVGRRWLAFGSMTLSGLFSCISGIITPDNRTAFLVTAIISRFWVNVAFNIGLQFAAELLPTVIRAQGVNIIHIMGYVASIISPFVAAIGRSNPTVSLFMLGIFAIIAGVVALFLSETLGEELPNTLEEAENFGKNQSFWNCPMCASRPEEDTAVITPDDAPAPVVMRNALRGSIRGATYRSSMISQVSSGGSSRNSRLIIPGFGSQGIQRSPQPNELTRLRRITN